jgi:hypothetical protein
LRCDLTAKAIDSISAAKGKLPLGILQKRGRGETTMPLPLIVTR